jgi:hemoglobin-like flavoprotein
VIAQAPSQERVFTAPMTPDQITAVEDTMRVVDVDELAADFYRRAFDADPELAPLFTTQPAVQRRRFAAELRMIVGSIRDLEAFRAAAADLGARHHDHGVRAAHYRTMGVALLASLRAARGTAWDAETEEAWALAYNLIAEAMMAGVLPAREGEPPGLRRAGDGR